MEAQASTLRECGCNAIRCSHNPHMPELYELCDELGFLMMDEAFDEWENPKNKWSTGHNVYPPRHQGYFEDFPQWHEVDLKAMVRRDRNHPSVIMWSIGNEIDYPNDPYCHPMFETMTGNNDADKPAAERTYDMNKPNAQRLSVLAARLAKMVRQEDKSRPVTLAAAFPELSSRIGFLDALDVADIIIKNICMRRIIRDFRVFRFWEVKMATAMTRGGRCGITITSADSFCGRVSIIWARLTDGRYGALRQVF
ncbi:MAG: glycoside hydrolase family 2 TIM barrel-domain containing protein [Eisenbergiella sp.]